jgi:hypothetical protein
MRCKPSEILPQRFAKINKSPNFSPHRLYELLFLPLMPTFDHGDMEREQHQVDSRKWFRYLTVQIDLLKVAQHFLSIQLVRVDPQVRLADPNPGPVDSTEARLKLAYSNKSGTLAGLVSTAGRQPS